ATVDDPGLGRELVAGDLGSDARNDAVDHNEPAPRLFLLGGIDKARVDEGDRRIGRHRRGGLTAAPSARQGGRSAGLGLAAPRKAARRRSPSWPQAPQSD